MGNFYPILAKLSEVVIYMVAFVALIKLRQYFSNGRTLSATPIAIRCALLWGGFLTIYCFGLILVKLLTEGLFIATSLADGIEVGSNYQFDSITFVLVPVAAVLGLIYGLVFQSFIRRKSHLKISNNQGLVGLVVGIVVGPILSLTTAFGLKLSYNIESGYGAILQLGLLYFLPICVVIFMVIFGLITPRNLLIGKAK